MIGIKDIAYHMPGIVRSTDSLLAEELIPENEKQYFEKSGIKSVIDAKDQDSFDLAVAASRKVMEQVQLDGESLDLIIYIKSRVPEYFLSSESTRLQHELNATRAQVFSISDLGCTDMSMAIKLAMDYLSANDAAENILIAFGSKCHASSRFRFPVTINGDGGVAIVIGREERNRIKTCKIESNGNYWDLLRMDFRNRSMRELKEELTDIKKYGFELAIEGKNRTTIMLENLQEQDINWRDCDHFILQNLTANAFLFYETYLKIKVSPVCLHNLGQYGHLGPADIMVNLKTGIDNGIFLKDHKILVINNSPSAAWSCLWIEI